ncbi:zf-TFIIB domain-containing protein [Micromonospora sp. WMMD710]|uniref:TFIIB-type zinc ribbon-containing protein n=1 Tax=Micromonospora sp. WMMD710 TaxID=3016085 RepID=UPI002416DBA1|nr:zf-TFIIB domain-containing protein [Micromonospora sp. WMMD710]MDG4761204.1 zf-TFIIB domain-containing protein [Micromonospora sp. WMMD710]
MNSLTCPKCHGEMRQYERSGVVIDQCGECRGIFLDRGELEKLFEAEANWSRQQAGGPPPAPAQQPGGYPPPHAPAQHQPGYGAVPPPPPPPAHGYPPAPAYGHRQHQGYHGHYRRKKKSFLDEMFG